MIINGKRALAYITKIDDISPLDGYDRVEYARVGGWGVIVSKADQFKPGDKCVYFEVDSKVNADDPRFAFMAKRDYKVKCIKMCKVYSQGLIMPVSAFDELKDANISDDVTDILKVRYSVEEDNVRKSDVVEKKLTLFERVKNFFTGKKVTNPRKFPTKFEYVKKSDEERCLIGDTKILTNIGNIRIADIVNKNLDVLVASVNANGEIEWKPIVGRQKLASEPKIEIGYPYRAGCAKLNHVVCSYDHKFMTQDGYKTAYELSMSDKLFMYTNCYSDDVIPFIYGSILGDAGVYHDARAEGDGIKINFTQGEAQREYLNFKMEYLGCEDSPVYPMKSGYADTTVYRFCLNMDGNISNHVLEDCWNGTEVILTNKMFEKITPLSLAIWYLDDGTLIKNNHDGGRAKISTCAFSLEENKMLVNMLNDKFGIVATIINDKGYYTLALDTENTDKFMGIICGYVPNCMRYKVTNKFANAEFILDGVVHKKSYRTIVVPVKSVNNYNGKFMNGSLYDITVADNHNFFANGVLTHNCENMPFILKDKEPWIKTQKIDGTSSTYIMEKKPFGRWEYYVCSRNVRQLDRNQFTWHNKGGNAESNVYWDMNDKYHIDEFLKRYIKDNNLKYAALQGETAGPNLQGNPHKYGEVRFFGYNLIRSDIGRINSLDAKEICNANGIDWVPIADEHYILPDDMETLKLDADGECIVGTGLREGWVYRSLDGQRSFKNVSRKYMMKHDE